MQYPFGSTDPLKFSSIDENQYFDRKSARKDVKDISRHIIAFANASGGKLVIGIEDDGEITGFKRDGAHAIESFEQAAISTCVPVPLMHVDRVPVINSSGENDQILILDIAASSDRVVMRKSDKKVFLRQKDESVELDREQVRALEYDKNQRSFEEEIVFRSSIEDVDREVLARYKKDIGTDLSDEQVLRSRGFLIDGHLTKAGVLIFAQNPTLFIPCARVRVIRFEGNNMETGRRLNIVKDRSFDGPLPRVIERVKAMVTEQLREFQYLGRDGKFKTIPEYPEFAWFEGVVNAVTHRNYAFSGDYIRVMLYDDRLEILSPGELPNIVTLENMRHTRYSRNPIIARALVDMGWVRELNEGVQRIYDEMAEFFLNDPVYSEPNGSSVLLTLENSATSRILRTQDSLQKDLSSEVWDSLNENEIIAVQYVYSHGRITTKELMELTGRAPRTVSGILKGLAEKRILVWHGMNQNDPTQYYSLRSAD